MKSFQRDTDKFNVFRVLPENGKPGAGKAFFLGKSYPCALGEGGVCPAYLKREGDRKTPAGLYFPRQLYFRPDRISSLSSHLPISPIAPHSGWCDDTACPDYNRPVSLPHPGSHEVLWRDDHIYDLVLAISHNDAPPTPGLGSAIFFHISRRNMSPTKGCVAFLEKDLLEILKHLNEKTLIRIHTL